jgi:hypothetical protein
MGAAVLREGPLPLVADTFTRGCKRVVAWDFKLATVIYR